MFYAHTHTHAIFKTFNHFISLSLPFENPDQWFDLILIFNNKDNATFMNNNYLVGYNSHSTMHNISKTVCVFVCLVFCIL